MCAQRILQRKSTGGHGHPHLAAELFDSSLSAASEFSLQSDYTFLIDTSDQLKLIAWLKGFNTVEVFPGVPTWATEYFPVYVDDTNQPEVPQHDLMRVPL